MKGIIQILLLLSILLGRLYTSALILEAGNVEVKEIEQITSVVQMESVGTMDSRPMVSYDIIEYNPEYNPTPEEIAEEERLGEMELIAQLVMAEAGNQDLTGKRLVVDVVLNRVDSPQFPNTVEEVIFQNNQFSVIKNGMFDAAAWTVTEECFEAVRLAYEERLNSNILYFSTTKSRYAKNHFKHQDHWFGW